MAIPEDPPAADLDQSSDDDLIAYVLGAEEPAASAAFAVLVHRHSGRLYAIAMGMVRNEQDARDCVQETFLAVHRKLDSFRGDASFKTWVTRITTNNALMKLRRRRRKPEASLEIRDPETGERMQREVVDLRPWADKVHEDRELGTQIKLAVEALPDNYREVLILADYQHMSMKEIGEALDLSVPNVKTRLHRARLRIRAQLRDYIAGEH